MEEYIRKIGFSKKGGRQNYQEIEKETRRALRGESE